MHMKQRLMTVQARAAAVVESGEQKRRGDSEYVVQESKNTLRYAKIGTKAIGFEGSGFFWSTVYHPIRGCG